MALKLLPLDQTADPEVVQRFYQEGRSAARLDHENIARVYSIGQDGPHHYIAFEYIEGTTVRRRVDEKGPLPVGEAVDITLQIAQALVHAASRGVVHRDIKPSNIILTPQGRAKLVDMGLARRFERDADHGLTQSGMTLGTFDYISPEQARDPRDVDVRSDLYSLGCTLFHMLSGRPPFPGGTVLQKLLQHQEEPPPEIRGLNPAVPVELARLITRLMAKDRDRRYQSPEQLVRDLLALAGQLGLAITTTEPHAWMSPGHRFAGERHLIWLVPAVAFLVLVAGLAWWARDPQASLPSEPGIGPIRAPRNELAPKERPAVLAGQTGAVAYGADAELALNPALQTAPRSIVVRPGDDLLGQIASAPPRSIITLSEDGPYLLGGRTATARGSWPLTERDLTIRAESGIHPVLRFAADARLGEPRLPALLPFSGGHVTIEGLAFELEREGTEERVAAILAEDTDLTIRGCLFRQSIARTERNRAALRVRSLRTRTAEGDRPPLVFADACHFDGGQVGLVTEGPAEILLRDCTMGPGSPTVWLNNGSAAGLVPTSIHMRHCSLMTGSGPVFDVQGTLARIMVEDCVIAPAETSAPTLIAIDSPRNLTWRGRYNLYSRIRAFLEPTRKSEAARGIEDFDHWKETPSEVRELGTEQVAAALWRSSQPWQELLIEQDNPTQAFQLASAFLKSPLTGARQGPYGARLADPTLLPESPLEVQSATSPTPAGETSASPPGTIPATPPSASSRTPQDLTMLTRRPANGVDRPVPATSAVTEEDDDPGNLPTMLPMSMPPAAGGARENANADAPGTASSPPVAKASQPGPPAESKIAVATSGTPSVRRQDESSRAELIHTAEQFSAALHRLGSKGGTLKIARDTDLELPMTEFAGSTRWSVEAEPGARRRASDSGRRHSPQDPPAPGRSFSICDRVPCSFKGWTCSFPNRIPRLRAAIARRPSAWPGEANSP